MDGEAISLDDIEHERLRPLIGWKVHSTVVCAARSCPPLLNRAYFADDWEDKMSERYRTWLGRGDLNRFLPDRKRAEVSKVFDWYGEDFEPTSASNLAKTKEGFIQLIETLEEPEDGFSYENFVYRF